MMALPKLIDHVNAWTHWFPQKKITHPCYLYNFKKMGITPEQFGAIISKKEVMLFEQPLEEHIRSYTCCWCDYNARKERRKNPTKGYLKGYSLEDHVYVHDKNPVDFQVQKFQRDLYSFRLQLVREGYHGALCFLVEHQCQICINPVVKGRPNMCSIPESPRNRMRSLKILGYPIEDFTERRNLEWSILGVIVLSKT